MQDLGCKGMYSEKVRYTRYNKNVYYFLAGDRSHDYTQA